ncbi:MAG: epimerase [Roseivirga sp.]
MKVIVTGSTGMVGKSVLLECLKSKEVEQVLVVNRRSLKMAHPKLKEVIHAEFLDLSPIAAQLGGYDACFHCMGVSVVGMKENEYTRLTFDLTAHWVKTLYDLNPTMVFNYVSGTGTDSSEQGRSMWARVKGKTENMVLGQGFKDAYAFRPGGILVEKGVEASRGSMSRVYAMVRPLIYLLGNTRYVTTGPNIGKAMINTVLYPQEMKHLENVDIDKLAKR